MPILTASDTSRRTLEILDDACDKLQTAIDLLCACNQLDESAMELDEFQLTEIICDSMSGDMTLEDLAVMRKSEIYVMCYQELAAIM